MDAIICCFLYRVVVVCDTPDCRHTGSDSTTIGVNIGDFSVAAFASLLS